MTALWIVLAVVGWALVAVVVGAVVSGGIRLRDRQVPRPGPRTGR